MTPTPPTSAQTLCLLQLSRGEQTKYLPPITRRELLRKRWIAKIGILLTADGPQFMVTSAGEQALATSQHLAEATRKLDAGKRSEPWQGMAGRGRSA